MIPLFPGSLICFNPPTANQMNPLMGGIEMREYPNQQTI